MMGMSREIQAVSLFKIAVEQRLPDRVDGHGGKFGPPRTGTSRGVGLCVEEVASNGQGVGVVGPVQDLLGDRHRLACDHIVGGGGLHCGSTTFPENRGRALLCVASCIASYTNSYLGVYGYCKIGRLQCRNAACLVANNLARCNTWESRSRWRIRRAASARR